MDLEVSRSEVIPIWQRPPLRQGELKQPAYFSQVTPKQVIEISVYKLLLFKQLVLVYSIESYILNI